MPDQDAVNDADRPSNQQTSRDFSNINSRFFKVDLQACRSACALGTNQAAAYLVLASGTGADHRTTAWSAKAVYERTGMHGTKAKEAILQLADAGLLRVVRDGTRPLYELNAFHDLAPEEAWLPQAFVGAASDSTSAIRFFRRQRSTGPLLAMLDIYGRTNMDVSCGVDWRRPGNPRLLYQKRTIRVTKDYLVHGFAVHEWAGGDLHFHTLNQLVQAKQIAVVPHIVEHSGRDAEIITPIGLGWHSLDWESRIGVTMAEAGYAMVQNVEFEPRKKEIIIPFPKHYPDIEVVGIVRPFLLPATVPTLKWVEKKAGWIADDSHYATLEDSFAY